MADRAWRVLRWAAGLAIVVFVARSVAGNWDQVRAADLAWRFRALPLLAGVATVWAVFALLALAWRRMVAGWGHPLRWWPAARIWLLSSMAKYVPGKVWALAGMAVMAQRRGVPAWAATGSAILLQVLAIGTGALVVAVSGLAYLDARGVGSTALLLLALASAVVTGVAVSPRVSAPVLRRFAPEAAPERAPPVGTLAFGAMANLLAWAGYGLALWLFAAGTLPDVPLGLGEAVGASTAAYVAGVLAPFAPGGLGVREGILVLLLQDRTGLAAGLALAAVSRLGLTLAEVLASLPFLALNPDPEP